MLNVIVFFALFQIFGANQELARGNFVAHTSSAALLLYRKLPRQAADGEPVAFLTLSLLVI